MKFEPFGIVQGFLSSDMSKKHQADLKNLNKATCELYGILDVHTQKIMLLESDLYCSDMANLCIINKTPKLVPGLEY